MRVLLALSVFLVVLACNPPTPPVNEDRADQARARLRYKAGLEELQQEKLTEALAAFDRAAALDPTYADPHRMRAAIFLRQRNRPDACAAMKRFVALDETPSPLREQVVRDTCAAK